MIGGIAKYFRYEHDFILWGISWANLLMLSASIPVYESDDEEKASRKPAKEIGGGDLSTFFGL